MPTVKQLKIDLDAKGIDYHKDDRKHELESLLVAYDLSQQDDAEECCPAPTEDCCPEDCCPAPEAPVERPRVIKAAADFIDPNADPATQAD